eukprot:7389127-Prymnesium_polylepis.2
MPKGSQRMGVVCGRARARAPSAGASGGQPHLSARPSRLHDRGDGAPLPSCTHSRVARAHR